MRYLSGRLLPLVGAAFLLFPPIASAQVPMTLLICQNARPLWCACAYAATNRADGTAATSLCPRSDGL